MAAINEHVDNIQAAIAAARCDGYLVEWDFNYVEWWGEREVSEVNMGLYRNRRGGDGVMRVDERARILSADV